MNCTAPDCENPTDLYLCNQCTSDLQNWLNKASDLTQELDVTVARLDKVRKASTEGGSGRNTGSAAPINLDAWQIRENLRTTTTAQEYAKVEDAADWAWTIQNWVKRAEILVLGEPEARVITTCDCGGKVISNDPAPEPTQRDPYPQDTGTCTECHRRYTTDQQVTRDRILGKCPEALPTRLALQWIADNAGIRIAPTDVRNWAREGDLNRTNPDEKKHPKYHVADILDVHFRKVDKGKRKPQAA